VSQAKNPEERIAELEREVQALRASLAAREANAPSAEDPVVARLLGDRALLASLPAVIAVLDREHRILYINRVVAERKVEDLLGKCMLDFLDEAVREEQRQVLERAWTTGEAQQGRARSVHGYFWESRVLPVTTDGRVTHILALSLDVTEKTLTEQALRASESRLQHAVDAAKMGTWSWDGRGAHWDDRLCRIYGIDPKDAPTSQAGVFALVHPDDRQRFVARTIEFAQKGAYEDVEYRIVRPDGEIRHLLSKGTILTGKDGKPNESYGAVFDVTEQRDLEERLRHSEKMDAIGRLTAGIAHNFNNILAIILSNAELCQRTAPPELLPRIDDIRHAGKRGAEMIRSLIVLARDEKSLPMEPVDVALLARRTIDMCRTTFDPSIRFELAVASDVPCAHGNAGQLEQALVNLFINARDAFEDENTQSPVISVTVDRADSGGVHVRISDNGPGMGESVRSRVFEPFFTTKFDKGGTGLGLSTAYGVVVDHGGRITCESRRGSGTVFDIELNPAELTP
jgi:PAS domain S-box-containing protein